MAESDDPGEGEEELKVARRAKVVVYCLFVALHRPRKTRTAESSTLLGKGLKHTTVLKSNGVKWVMITNRIGNKAVAVAMSNLSEMYADGRGVPKDDVLAFMWADLSDIRGDKNASVLRDSLEKRMSSTQIEEAQRLSREWMDKHPKK
jgi:TPR repeat protein